MTSLIIVAAILIVVMVVFVFVLLKSITKRMDENAKRYFVNKMKDYDYMINDKQEKLDELEQEINKVEIEYNNILHREEKNVEEPKEKKIIRVEAKDEEFGNSNIEQEEVKYNLNVPEYRETHFFDNYKEVRKTFTANNEKIIKDFIAEHKDEKNEKEYKSLKKLRKKFDENTVYECLTLTQEEQIKILQEVLTEAEKKLVNLNKLIANEKFTLKDLIDNIDDRMEKIDPTVYIYTNISDNKYEELDSNIVTMHYDNMSEGIIIKYKNKIYDYSI